MGALGSRWHFRQLKEAMTAVNLLSVTVQKETQRSWEKLKFKSFHKKNYAFLQFLWISLDKEFGTQRLHIATLTARLLTMPLYA